MTPPERLLADVRGALRVVWVAGMARPDPSLPPELADLALAAHDLGWSGLAEALSALRRTLGPGDTTATFHAARAVWVRVHLLDRQLALHLLEARLHAEAEGTAAVEPTRPRGREGTVWPLGVVVDGERTDVHALDERGDWVTLEDLPVAMDREVPGPTRTVSRLFQGELRWIDVATGEVELVGQPGTRTAARWVGRPAFHTHPRLRVRRTPGPLPGPLPLGARLAVGTARVTCTPTPDGWQARSGGATVAVPPLWAFDLDKRTLLLGDDAGVVPSAVLVARGDRRELLQVDDPPRFPTLDPAATTAPVPTWARGLDDDEAAQLAALAWPHTGGDRQALTTALAPATQSPTLDVRWAAQHAGAALGLPPPDRNPLARERLGRADAAGRPARELLVALALAERHEPLGPTLAGLLLDGRQGPVDEDDAHEVALRAWCMARAGRATLRPFLEGHLGRWQGGHPLPDADGLLWLAMAYDVARGVDAELAPRALPRLASARAALGALRGPTPVEGWRWAAADGLLGWFLPPS